MDPNPYESPLLPAEPENPATPSPPQARFAWLVLPTLAGVFIGATLLAPDDTRSQSIGAGLGGLVGLAVGVILRVWTALRNDLT